MSDTKVHSPEELVKRTYPTAYVDDDKDWIYIRYKETVTEKCPHCNREGWTHEREAVSGSLGSGGTISSAWEDAARSLGLL